MSFINSIEYDEKTKTSRLNVKVGSDYIKDAKVFLSIYSKDAAFILTEDKKLNLKKRNERICRFCGKAYPDVKFKKKAHLVPELIGNKNLLSDFECDNCNYDFGLLENEFANFLGLSRTLSMQSGKKGIPTFKSPDKNLTIREEKEGGLLFSEVINDKSIRTNKESEKVVINTTKHPHCRTMVYKCLVKIGLSLIKEEDISEYKESINFLRNKKLKKYENSLFTIHHYFIPGPYVKFPILMSFKKKSKISNNLLPSRTFVIYFHNRMIQFFIPFDPNDKKINMPNSKIEVSIVPPLVNQEWINLFGKPKSEFINLDNPEKIRNASEQITIRHI